MIFLDKKSGWSNYYGTGNQSEYSDEVANFGCTYVKTNVTTKKKTAGKLRKFSYVFFHYGKCVLADVLHEKCFCPISVPQALGVLRTIYVFIFS